MFAKIIFLVLTQLLAVAFGQEQIVQVGAQGLQFLPDTIYAGAGSTIKFQFVAATHNVAEGTYDKPCTPSGNTSFYSGTLDTTQVFTIKINDTNPIFIYCSTPGHCEAGMVAVINPGSGDQTLNGYRSAAANANSIAPATVQGGIVQEASAASSSAASSSVSATASSTSATTSATAKSEGIRVKVGVVGAVVVAGLFFAIA